MWKTDIKTFDLFQGLAARLKIPANDLENGHKVRDYRNRLVHEREDLTPPVEVAIARRYLCTFFSYLPKQW